MNIQPCKTFLGYSASECGRVFSNRKRYKLKGSHGGTKARIDPSYQKELRQITVEKGYLQVSIQTGKGIRPIGVHRIVMDAFEGPPQPGHQVRHLDNNPSNNRISNLAYGTVQQNANDRMNAGHYFRGGRHHASKLTNEQADQIRSLRSSGEKVKNLAGTFGVSVSTIQSIIYRKSY